MLSTKHHILVIGGTGLCGILFVRAALDASYQVTIYARTPSKIPEDLSSNPNLHTIQGELGDEEALKKAAACGADIFISLAGPTLGRREGTPITNALKILYPLLLSNGTTKRILALSTASYSAEEDQRSIVWWLGINIFIRGLGGDSYPEIRGIAQETVALGESMNWTVFRVPGLFGTTLDGNPGEVNACYIGDKRGRDGLTLERGRLAKWILGELDEGKWIGACPALANA